MLPGTYQALKEARLLSTDRQANALVNVLGANIVSSADDVDDLALINDEMRVSVFGDTFKDGTPHDDDTIYELNEIVGELTRPEGAVYQALDNGYDHLTLGTARVRRQVTTATGVNVIMSKNGRFLTDDPEIAMAYRELPAIKRAEQAWDRAQARIERDTRKIPALAQYAPQAIAAAHQRMTPRKQLGKGK